MARTLTQVVSNQITTKAIKPVYTLIIGSIDVSTYLLNWSISHDKSFGSASASFTLHNNSAIFSDGGSNNINLGDIVEFYENYDGDTVTYKRFYGVVSQRNIDKSSTTRTISLTCLDYISTLQYTDIDLICEGTKVLVSNEVLTPIYLPAPNDSLAQVFNFANDSVAQVPVPILMFRNKNTAIEDVQTDGYEIQYSTGQLKLGSPINAKYNYDVMVRSYYHYTKGLYVEDIIEDILTYPDGYGKYLFNEPSAQAVIDNHLTETFLNIEGISTDTLTPNTSEESIDIEHQLSVATTAGITYIYLDSVEGLPESGEGSINGDIFTWTSIDSGNVLSGIPSTGEYSLKTHVAGSYFKYTKTYDIGQVWYMKYNNILTDLEYKVSDYTNELKFYKNFLNFNSTAEYAYRSPTISSTCVRNSTTYPSSYIGTDGKMNLMTTSNELRYTNGYWDLTGFHTKKGILAESRSVEYVLNNYFSVDANSDGKADSWNIRTGVTASLISASDISNIPNHNWQRIQYTFTGIESDWARLLDQSTSSGSFALNDWVTCTLLIKGSTNITPGSSFNIHFESVNSSGVYQQTIGSDYSLVGFNSSTPILLQFTTQLTAGTPSYIVMQLARMTSANKPQAGDTLDLYYTCVSITKTRFPTSFIPNNNTVAGTTVIRNRDYITINSDNVPSLNSGSYLIKMSPISLPSEQTNYAPVMNLIGSIGSDFVKLRYGNSGSSLSIQTVNGSYNYAASGNVTWTRYDSHVIVGTFDTVGSGDGKKLKLYDNKVKIGTYQSYVAPFTPYVSSILICTEDYCSAIIEGVALFDKNLTEGEVVTVTDYFNILVNDYAFNVSDNINYFDKRFGRIILNTPISITSTVTCDTDYNFKTLQATGVELNYISFKPRELDNRYDAILKLKDYLAPNYIVRTIGDNKIWSSYLTQRPTADYNLDLITSINYLDDEDIYTRVKFYGKNVNPNNLMLGSNVDFMTTGETYRATASNVDLTYYNEENEYWNFICAVSTNGRIELETIIPEIRLNGVPINNTYQRQIMTPVNIVVDNRVETKSGCHGISKEQYVKVHTYYYYTMHFSHTCLDPNSDIILYDQNGGVVLTLSSNDPNMDYKNGVWHVPGEEQQSIIETISSATYTIFYSTGDVVIDYDNIVFKISKKLMPTPDLYTVTATFEYWTVFTPVHDIAAIIDGRWDTQVQTEFFANVPTGYNYAILDLGGVKNIQAIDLVAGFFKPDEERKFDIDLNLGIQTSLDNVTYNFISSETSSFDLTSGQSISFEESDLGSDFTTRYLKLILNSVNSIDFGNSTEWVVALTELSAYDNIVLSSESKLIPTTKLTQTIDPDLYASGELYTIYVESTEGFEDIESGTTNTAYIGTDSFTYLDKTATTFIGCAGLTEGHLINEYVYNNLETDTDYYDTKGLLTTLGDKLYKNVRVDDGILYDIERLNTLTKAYLKEFIKNHEKLSIDVLFSPYLQVGQTVALTDSYNNKTAENYFIEKITESSGKYSLVLARYPEE